MSEAPKPGKPQGGAEGEHVTGPSRLMMPLIFVYFFLVMLIWPVLGEYIGELYASMAVFGIIALLSLSFVHEALSRSAFARVEANYPGLKRENWMVNVLMQDVIIPLAAVALFVYLV